mmetsp:Transcript_46760/g.123129  ORF Transcript_46760/g.123129 Transcript_46760/m.123129 type:complete len:483 (+) Transcript_46760:2498-3946(+)
MRSRRGPRSVWARRAGRRVRASSGCWCTTSVTSSEASIASSRRSRRAAARARSTSPSRLPYCARARRAPPAPSPSSRATLTWPSSARSAASASPSAASSGTAPSAPPSSLRPSATRPSSPSTARRSPPSPPLPLHQTLSYTDGISDDLEAIVDLIEAENAKRQAADVPLVTLINDSCLAFCVLVHNDGTEGAACLRVLELTASRATPTIVTLDAHKHLGTDKGVSTVLGSLGTLSHLRGHVRVGAQPAEGELVRALADMLLVGVDGYVAKYHSLAAALEAAAQRIQSNGMAIVHAHHRAKGSTVIACEDPSAVMTARLKKLGHSFAYLFNLAPDEPHACQTGWSLSLTPHCLRLLQPGRTALDVFLDDLVATHKQVEPQRAGAWHVALFKESSLLGTLLAGGTLDPFLFSMLWKPGFGRALAETVVRRLFSSLLDSGVTRSHKLQAPLRLLLRRLFLALGAALALLIVQARRARKRRLLRHR